MFTTNRKFHFKLAFDNKYITITLECKLNTAIEIVIIIYLTYKLMVHILLFESKQK